jgi:hypothetical protein
VPALAGVLAVVLAGLGFYLLKTPGSKPAAARQNIASQAPLTNQAPATSGTSAALPTPPPGAPYFSRIDSISLASGKYVVNFETFGFQPQLGGANKHVHFFWDTVPPSQAGRPGDGPWQLYPTSYGTIGGSPFTMFGVSDVPPGARQICILVANSDHSVIQGTGNCMNLP